jgi:glycosyltransferase involved in cell wall biosynthesis
MTKVSIIIPTYNRSALLPRAIQSVINQTYRDWELLIIDDGSTDNTKDVVDEFIKKDSRIKYLYQENSGGPAKPRNVGIRESTGEFIIFLDSDDEMLPEKIAKQLTVFDRSDNIGFVGCHVFVIETNKIPRIEKISHEGNVLGDLLLGDFIWSCSNVMVRKDCFLKNNILFDEKMKYSDDWDMWIQLSKKYDFDYADAPLMRYYFNYGGNITLTISDVEKMREKEYLINKYHNEYQNLGILFTAKKDVAINLIIMGDSTTGRKHLKEIIRIKPFSLKLYLIYFSSFLGKGIFQSLINVYQRYTQKSWKI